MEPEELTNKIKQANSWNNLYAKISLDYVDSDSDNLNASNDLTSVSVSSYNTHEYDPDLSNTGNFTITTTTNDGSGLPVNIDGNLSNQGAWSPPLWTTYITSGYDPSEPSEKNVNVEMLKDLKSEIEDKIEDCDNKIDEIFEQMKSDRKKTPILNPTFQYFVGMRQAYDTLLEKLNKYIKESSDSEEELEENA